MNRRTLNSLIATLVLAAGAVPALAQGTAFTYQGELQNSGSPVNTPADFEFKLFDAITGGTQVGPTIVRSAVSVASGRFTTPVDFGVNAYTSNRSFFLQIAVRNPAGSGSFVTLGSRQALAPTPFSLATRGINVGANGDIALLAGADRRINVPSTPLNANGTNLIVTAGEANSIGNAADGGDLILEAGRAFNADQSFIRPGDVIIRSGGNLLSALNAPNGGDIIFQSGAAFSATAERMRITPAGNVGIGTAAPSNKLSVSGTADITGNVGIGTPTPQAPLHVRAPQVTTAAVLQVDTCGAPCGGPNHTEALRLINIGVAGGNPNGVGQVGIGMTSASAATATSTADVWIGTGFFVDPGNASNDFIIATKTSPTALTNRVRVNGDNGNVGIGTDTPAARLHNVGTTRLDGSLQFGADLQNGNTLRWGRFDGVPDRKSVV